MDAPRYFEPGVITLRHHPAKTVVFVVAFGAHFGAPAVCSTCHAL